MNHINKSSSSQRLLIALKEARAKLEAIEQSKSEPIAIIGYGCRFPGGANDPQAFWQLLHDGVDAITECPSERWDVDAYYDQNPDTPGKIYTRHGGFLSQIDQFDPQFFEISPKETKSLDPQQRLLLEVSWEALENAGRVQDKQTDKLTGVFIGISANDYARVLMRSGDLTKIDSYFATGNTFNAAAGRLSYTLGFQGPCMAIDTACSSSLVAVHTACQSLRNGECRQALAGGVNLILSPESTIALCQAKILSPEGRCKTFDAEASGMARGEGCGIVVLKRFSDAVADGDNILALIRGSAVNQDGSSSGLTVPHGPAQETLIRQALANARVEPKQVSYLEAHGTGTYLGDPIELRALSAVLGEGRLPEQPLLIGSVKTNLGHLESASGIAGLLKVVLMLQHQEIPPHLHFKRPNPHVDWNKLSVKVPTERMSWLSNKGQRIAGVSSFGLSGTNAHLVLEEAPPVKMLSTPPDFERPLHLLTLSAKSAEALKQLSKRYENHLAANPTLRLCDIGFSANTGRTSFNHRLSVVGSSTAEAREKLAAFTAGQETTGFGQVTDTGQPKIAFLFTGQGSQYVGMARQLYETQPTFRQTIDRCNEILRPYLEKPLLEVLYPVDFALRHEPNEKETLDETAYTQPALFALEYALAQLWQSWGIQPSIVMGHSVGEYVAACLAGVFSLEDGLKLIAARGRLMQTRCEKGEMLALSVDEKQAILAIQPYAQEVSIAAINGPDSVVISGRREAIQAVKATLETEGIETRPLKVSHAFHSPLMEPMLTAFEQIANEVTYSAPQIRLCSNLTGQWVTDEITTPDYWCRHVRQPVLFAASMETLYQQGYELFLEIGPKPTLLGMGRQCLPEGVGTWLVSLRKGQEDWQLLLQSLGELYVRGVSVNWFEFDRDYPQRRIELPTYPFQRQRYWVDFQEEKSVVPRQARGSLFHPLLGQQLYSAVLKNGEIQFESQINQEIPAFLKHHCIHQTIIFPASAYFEMALAAGARLFNSDELVLEEIIIQQALILPEVADKTLQLILSPEKTGKYSFQIFSLTTDEENQAPFWTTHFSGKVFVAPNKTKPSPIDLSALKAYITEEMSVSDFYRHYQEQQMNYGPSFQAIQQLWRHKGEALGQIRLADTFVSEAEQYKWHPAFLDACLQVIGATVLDTSHEKWVDKTNAYMPVGLERFSMFAHSHTLLWSHAKIRAIQENQHTFTADVRLFTPSGEIIAIVEGFLFRQTSREALLDATTKKILKNWLYEIVWRSQEPSPMPQETSDNVSVTQAAPVNPNNILSESSIWLILTDSQGTGQQLATLLRARGEIGILVFSGDKYEQLAEQTFRINPTSLEDFQTLFNKLETNSYPWYRVVHLWSLESSVETENLRIEDLEMANHKGCASVMYLVQSLIKKGFYKPPSLWLVTRGSQSVGVESTPPAVAQSPLWGMGRVIALEHPELWGGMLDLAPHPDDYKVEAETVCSEILQSTGEYHIAYRDNNRYVARLVRRKPQQFQKTPFDSDGIYLITGGLGFLGRRLASWMVEQGVQHLVLIGRSGLPERQTWANLPKNTATWEQIQTIQQLEERGTSVTILQADVSDFTQMSWVFEQVKITQLPLRGIMHAAGIPGYQAMQALTYNDLEAVFRAKITGTWLLHQLTQNLELDFFVCFSSASAVWGAKGQAHYAAANHFLDIFAYYRRAIGLPALSINWGLLEGGGMTHNEAYHQWLVQIGIEGLQPEQGFIALDYLLDTKAIQTTVAKVDWNTFKALYEARQQRPLLDEIEVQPPIAPDALQSDPQTAEILQRLKEVSTNEHQTLLTEYLQAQIAKTLQWSPSQLDVQQPLSNMGFDSLMAMELRNRIKTDLNMDVPLVKFMEGFSVASLATLVNEQINEQLAKNDFAIQEEAQKEVQIEISHVDNLKDNAGEMLGKLDQITDEDVDVLLNSMLSEEKRK